MSALRVDKWLWTVRIFKTRGDAAEACRTNKVTVNGAAAKPSRELRAGDVAGVRKGSVNYSYRVLGFPGSRMRAGSADQYAENITPQEEFDKLNIPRETIFVLRERGTGRPTKKERRKIDALMKINN